MTINETTRPQNDYKPLSIKGDCFYLHKLTKPMSRNYVTENNYTVQ